MVHRHHRLGDRGQSRRQVEKLCLGIIIILLVIQFKNLILLTWGKNDTYERNDPVGAIEVQTQVKPKLRSIISSESLPIFLIDTSNQNRTNIAASTWGGISPHWNRTTHYSSLLNIATTFSSLPNEIKLNDKMKRRQIVLLHCAPKLGSSTLRHVCRNYMEETCRHFNLTIMEGNESGPAGYFGGERLLSIMSECVDTHYFCVNMITMTDMLSFQTWTTKGSDDESDMVAATTKTAERMMSQNIEYIHLFPFRNYNDWVKSAVKQMYDRGGATECDTQKSYWDDGKCHHSLMEADIRKYSRVDLDRFQDGVVKRMNGFYDDRTRDSIGREDHTILLYLNRDLERALEKVSEMYHLPRLPGANAKLKGGRPEGTCDKSVEELYHECFSDELMSFRWDLPKNQGAVPDHKKKVVFPP